MTNVPNYSISTPENVDLHLELAGLGNRILACLIDTVLTYVGVLLLALPALLYPKLIEFVGPPYTEYKPILDFVFLSLVVVGSFLIVFLYFIVFEIFWQGQTPGKKIMGIRVVDSLGQPVATSSVWIRNLLRPIDEGPFLVGLLVMLVDKNERRLGDLAANTIVIRERLPESLPALVLSGAANSLDDIDAGLISLAEYELLRDFLKRRTHMAPSYRQEAGEKLAEHFALSLQLPEAASAPEPFLERIYSAYGARAENV
jgi:uncharacterized RDD family membrane protein YckC